MTKNDVKDMLKTDDKFMYQSLITLYRLQTADERAMDNTFYQNGVGFSAIDSDLLSSFSRQFLDKGYLSDKQKNLLRVKLMKYSGQLMTAVEMDSLADVIIKDAPVKVKEIPTVTIEIKKSDKLNGEYSAFVSFNYDYKLVEIVKQLRSRWYHNETKNWEVGYKELTSFINQLEDGGYKYSVSGMDMVAAKQKIDLPIDYEYKTKPFSHQVEAIEFGLNHDKWLLGDSMGLGKTKVAIDLACMFKKDRGYKHCLILCGVNGLKWNWVNEIKIHSNEGSHILGQKEKNGNVRIGSNGDKLNDIVNLSAINKYFIITNIQTLRDEKCALELKKRCLDGEIDMIVFDEAHMCKNTSSQQGKGALKLSAKTMIAMTGTPLMNTPLDLYFIMKWLGYEKHSFYAFKNHHCIMGGYGGYEVIGYKNLDELQDRLNEIMIRRLKEDVFDLPEKTYINEYVEMTPKQKQIYDQVKQEIKDDIDRIAMSNNPLAELIRMRQATGYTGILSSNIEESAKLDRLEELVDEAINNNQKVVVFSNWIQMTSPIRQRLESKYNCAVITGEYSTEDRQKAIDSFQNDADCKVIIGTIGAMGTGITLTAGTVEIFVDEPWTMASKEQAVDRCHRIGTTSNVTIYTLLAKDTIDERIHDIVEQKGLMSDAIVDGKIAVDKKELLNYLLN